MWSAHLSGSRRGSRSASNSALGEGDFIELEEEHQEPRPRPQRQREITIRRHKDITEEDVALSRKLWLWGFFALPFLWLVNYVFFRHALSEPTAPDSMRKNIRHSLYAFILAMVVWVAWLIVFYTNMHGSLNSLLLFSPDTTVDI